MENDLSGGTAGPRSRQGPRAIALVGPQGVDESIRAEALLAAAGTPVRRLGEPRERATGTETLIRQTAFLAGTFALIDCPGSVEFGDEAAAALAVADRAVVVCERWRGRAAALAPLRHGMKEAGLACQVLVNTLDTLGEAPVRDTLAPLQSPSRRPLVLRQVPIREGGTVIGLVDLVSERAYRYRPGAASEHVRMREVVAGREREARASLAETSQPTRTVRFWKG